MEWISVKERLPKKDGDYFTARHTKLSDGDDYYYYSVIPYSVAHNKWNHYDSLGDNYSYEADNVAYWMPFPRITENSGNGT